MVNENFKTEVTVRRSAFLRNYGGYGGAMSLYDSNVTVQGCTFDSNEVRVRGCSPKLVWNSQKPAEPVPCFIYFYLCEPVK